MSRHKISERIQQQVRNRANYLCEWSATVTALILNRERVIAIRSADREIGRHPPIDDSIQANI